ncbi:hypothetical protein HDU93_005807 [Gonapodya sp. JEL0774]|nr:hypothetical protein HDU93_005807 [Gonapodya sp. JEL0774]
MLSRIGTTVGVLHNKDLRALNESEKQYVVCIKDMNKQASKASKDLVVWASKETEGHDLEELAKAVEEITTTMNELFESYSVKHEDYRSNYKSILRREEHLPSLVKQLDEGRKKLDDATKKSKPVDHLKREVEAAEREVEQYEVELAAFKRSTLKVAFDTRFDSLIELGSKLALTATFGKFLTSQIPPGGDRLTAFDSEPMKHILSDLHTSLAAWRPAIEVSDSTGSIGLNTGAGAISPMVEEPANLCSYSESDSKSSNASPSASTTEGNLLFSDLTRAATISPTVYLSRSGSIFKTTTPPGKPVEGTEILNPYMGKPVEIVAGELEGAIPNGVPVGASTTSTVADNKPEGKSEVASAATDAVQKKGTEKEAAGTTVGVLHHKELRNLNESEKQYTGSIRDMNKDALKTAKDLVMWATKEDNSKDLEEFAKSVESAVTTMNSLFESYADKHEDYRSHYKSILRREENLAPLTKRLEEARKKVEDATKKNKPVDHLKREVEEAQKEYDAYEAELAVFKRSTLKVAFETRFDALMELGSKIAIAATFGKFLASQIPQGEDRPAAFDPTPMKHILSDLNTSLSAWRPLVETSNPLAPTPVYTGAGSISGMVASPVSSAASPSSSVASPASSVTSSASISKAESQTKLSSLTKAAVSPTTTSPPTTFLSRTLSIIKTKTPPGKPVEGTAVTNTYPKPGDTIAIPDGIPVSPAAPPTEPSKPTTMPVVPAPSKGDPASTPAKPVDEAAAVTKPVDHAVPAVVTTPVAEKTVVTPPKVEPAAATPA